MIQTLTKNWWLMALCGVLYVPISVIYFILYYAGPGSTPFIWNEIIPVSGRFVLAAGVCSIAAGIWRPARSMSSLWALLLVLNGLALSVFGGIGYFWSGPLGFDLFLRLIVVMAMSAGILALAIARSLRKNAGDAWFFGLTGAASVGVGLAFLALVNGWIQLGRRAFHPAGFLWVCLYFAFAAILMLGLSLRLQRRGFSQSGQWDAVPPLGNPSHA
jgi:uncharacterized membrane protein HdeD (DUF308 family)